MAYIIILALFDGILLIVLTRIFFNSRKDLLEAFLFSRDPVVASYFSKKGGRLFLGALKLLLIALLFLLVLFLEYRWLQN